MKISDVLTISNCCMMYNNPNGIGRLFKVSDQVILHYSYYDKLTYTNNMPVVQETTTLFINKLSHLSTANCVASIPLISNNYKPLETESRDSLRKNDTHLLVIMAYMA